MDIEMKYRIKFFLDSDTTHIQKYPSLLQERMYNMRKLKVDLEEMLELTNRQLEIEDV
jgi:hypothetical protein